MSYLDQAQDPRRRAAAIAVTVGVHAALGVVVVTGLTIAGITPTRPFQPTIEFPLPEPPAPAPTPTPTAEPDARIPLPPAPVPPIPLPPSPGPVYREFDETDPLLPTLPVIPDPGPTFQPPPRPSPSMTPTRARPKGSPAEWISTDDYPRNPLVNGIEGIAGYRVIVGSNGRVSSCEVTAPSGNAQLDATTCRLITRRARFEPATDESGARVVGSYSGTVRWEIPD